MNMRALLRIGLLFCFVPVGCDDAFSPKGALLESPILYCVLEISPLQEYYILSATLTSVYDVEGFNPRINTMDPTIERATISLINGSRTYQLQETLLPRPAGSPYEGCWHIYRATRAYIRTQDSLRLTARLPDGRELSARTTVPSYKPVSTFPLYTRGVTTQLPSLYFGSAWIINWDDFAHEDHLFFPRLELVYEISTPSGPIVQGREVPLRYLSQDESLVPLYPKVTSARELAFDFDAIDATMAAISEGDPDKARYRVIGFSFELIELDFALSRYYASVNGSLDQLSIRLEETVFTNITGGHGVFGTSMANSRSFTVEAEYAASFGYSTGSSRATAP